MKLAFSSTLPDFIFIFLSFFLTENITMICDEECLGGCQDPTPKGCRVCRNFRVYHTGKCVKTCPEDLYVYYTLCVNATYCKQHRRQPILGECRQKCDAIETNNGIINSGFGSNTTPTHCSRSCLPVDVDSLATSDYVRGCQIITGDLFIRIREGDINTQKYLERNLGDIEEVHGQLKVYRSHAITSLSFLRNLRVIRGDPNPRWTLLLCTFNWNWINDWF